MRLICPNCDAQYEVDAALIPAAGRDVQCSNCGTTWFQEPQETIRLTPGERVEPEPAMASEGPSGHGLTEEAAEFFGHSGPVAGLDEAYEDEDEGTAFAATAAPPRPAPATEPAVASARSAQPEPAAGVELYDEAEIAERDRDEDVVEEAEPESVEAPEPEPVDVDEDLIDADEEAPVERPARPELDAAVLGILRAEAEREIAARRAEAEGIEAPPPSAPDDNREAVEARTARLRGLDDEEQPGEASARRALLPDIDEINSTLTATSDRAGVSRIDEEVPPEVTRKRRSGFRMGFSLVMLAVAVLILLYLFAPKIGATVPSLEPVLAGYVDWANGVRQSVDGYLERSISSLTDFLVKLSS